MKIVIDIPEDDLYMIQRVVEMGIGSSADRVIYHGTPLPKGHGDLIDRSKIHKPIPAEEDNCTGMGMTLEEMDAYNEGIDAMYSLVKVAPTIIEADKEVNGDDHL